MESITPELMTVVLIALGVTLAVSFTLATIVLWNEDQPKDKK